MNKLNWCIKIKNGIGIKESSEYLTEAYLKKAEDSLETMKTITSKEWKVTTAYYGMYFSVYAILSKIGVKCEIHACTIEFIKNFLSYYFSKKEITFLSKILQARIDSQYYTDKELTIKSIKNIERKAEEFSLKCKSIAKVITKEEVATIRRKLSTQIITSP